MCTAVPASASPVYSDVFFLGTSELDAVNWLLNPTLSGNALAPTAIKGYWNGRWHEGPAWSDYFAAALGHDATASLAGGQNYAYGVAWLGPLPGAPAPTPGSLAAEPTLYFGTHRANLAVDEMERLAAAGATQFLVQTLGGVDAHILTYNQTLLSGLAAIGGITVSVVDTRTFNQTIVLAPGFLAGLGITDFGSCMNARCAWPPPKPPRPPDSRTWATPICSSTTFIGIRRSRKRWDSTPSRSSRQCRSLPRCRCWRSASAPHSSGGAAPGGKRRIRHPRCAIDRSRDRGQRLARCA